MIRLCILLVVGLAVAGCGQRAPFDPDQVDLRLPDASVLQGCALAVDLGSDPLTQAQAEAAWITDRVALRDCRAKHAILSAYVVSIAEAFSGE